MGVHRVHNRHATEPSGIEDLSNEIGFESLITHMKSNSKNYFEMIDGSREQLEDFSFIDFDKIGVDYSS